MSFFRSSTLSSVKFASTPENKSWALLHVPAAVNKWNLVTSQYSTQFESNFSPNNWNVHSMSSSAIRLHRVSLNLGAAIEVGRYIEFWWGRDGDVRGGCSHTAFRDVGSKNSGEKFPSPVTFPPGRLLISIGTRQFIAVQIFLRAFSSLQRPTAKRAHKRLCLITP